MATPINAPAPRSALRILGFPLHLRPGFFLFLALIVFVNGSEVGLWLAGSVAVITLIHELGHALVARAAGARAEISLDFLAGYASFVPSRPLSRPVRAAIAVAGPGVHIVFSTVVLLAIGANPLDLSTIDDSPARLAIFWAGPVIGLSNLLPILPLDGGNIVETGLSWFLPTDARKVMLWFSIGLTCAGVVFLMLDDERRGLIPFAGILLLMQLQLFYADRDRTDDMAWLRADEKMRRGDTVAARAIVQRAVASPAHMANPPGDMVRARLEALIHNLGPTLPVGNATNELHMAEVLVALGQHERAAHYGADAYARHQSGPVAATVARACNAAGDPATAIAWLRTATSSPSNPTAVARIIDHAPELGSLRMHPEVVTLRRGLDAALAR